MQAASLQSYLGGENTEAARRRIVADYLNSVPLAAIAGHGEVTGLCDGLWVWYGADPDELNRLLWEEARVGRATDSAAIARRAVAYRQVLSLMLALRRPSYLLLQAEGRDELRRRTDQHLRLVAGEGIISAELRDAALAVDLTPRSRAPDVPRVSFILQHTGRPVVDLRARAGDWITAWTLAYLAANPGVSLERILEAAMSRPYSASPGESLTGRDSHTLQSANDQITDPVLAYQSADGGVSVERTLEAAMPRLSFSSPPDSLTNSVTHTFRNSDTTNDQQAVSVRDAFIRSVNLPFIRIMRDIVHYHAYRLPGGMHLPLDHPAEAPWDRDETRRQEYAARLANTDGRELINQFFQKYKGADSGSRLEALGRGRSVTQLAWAYRSVTPQAGLEEFGEFLQRHVAEPPSDARIAELYDGSDPTEFSISDRGHLAGMHPLEVWLAGYLRRHPGAPRLEVLDSSASVRRGIYGGLVPPSRPAAPGQWIVSIPESRAFREIYRSWRRLGYPFESLAPSYATAIGSSADRPEALAELVGILLSDGVRYPVRRVDELHFAAGTPYETLLRLSPHGGERVLSSEIAAVMRAAMVGVVTRGTARRGVGAVRASDGSPLTIGAKTGTGNNRFRVVGPDGLVSEDRAIDRTATVIFFIGDRFYGTITAFVSGAAADRYHFTSSLPVQILKMLRPTLEPLIAGHQD